MMRHSTGIAALDELLGGGLIPGTLTVVLGATGIGKTQLGLQFAQAGARAEGQKGVIFDMSARGDSQSHAQYAERLFGWKLQPADHNHHRDLSRFFEHAPADYLHIFDYSGRRVTRRDLDFDQWHDWQVEMNAKLRQAIAFLYGNFCHGVRRVVIDGVEPAQRAYDSIQLDLFEYVYHQVIRQDPLWVARDLFRETYRQQAESAAQYVYDSQQVSCLLLCTSQEMMLEQLVARPLEEGDSLANANTLIYMGKVPQAGHMQRALLIGKHRGSACSDKIVPFEITAEGLRIGP